MDHRPPDFDDAMLLAACRSCGACCAGFRIMVNWTEIDDFAPDGVPADLIERFGEYVAAMRMGAAPEHRCIALEGTIGQAVTCTIYERRGSACREFSPLTGEGRRNLNCDAARRTFGLPPLSLPPWA